MCLPRYSPQIPTLPGKGIDEASAVIPEEPPKPNNVPIEEDHEIDALPNSLMKEVLVKNEPHRAE